MHSLVSSSASSAGFYRNARRSRSASVSVYASQRRYSNVTDIHKYLLSSASNLAARRHSMATTLVASNAAKNNAPALEDKSEKAKLIDFGDPISSRTLTVEETFKRMEELVGSEEEPKNWKGIVISLLVIVFILAMIVLAIVLVSEGKQEDDPGVPLTFDMLTNPFLHRELSAPLDFHFTSDGEHFVSIIQKEKGRAITLNNVHSNSDTVELVPSELFQSELRHLSTARLSPDSLYLLLKIQSDESSNPWYYIYERESGRFVDDSHFQNEMTLRCAYWIGDQHELLYIKDEAILFRPDLNNSNPVTISNFPSNQNTITYNGHTNSMYREILEKDCMVWVSPDSMYVAFARFRQNITKSPPSQYMQVTVHIAEIRSFNSEMQLTAEDKVDTSRLVYLKAMSWTNDNRLMVVWLDQQQKTVTYLLCNVNSSICYLNYEYEAEDVNLHWTDVYTTPVFGQEATDTNFYTIFPDPENEFKLHRHLASIELNPLARKEPKKTYLTKHAWSDNKIVHVDKNILFFTSTGRNYTHNHLYSINLANSHTKCLTCDLQLGVKCFYVDVIFSKTSDKVMLSCLGPDIPSYHILLANRSTAESGEEVALTYVRQIDTERHQELVNLLEDVKLPTIEYYTVKLDNDMDASVKLHVPAVVNRTLTFTYGLVIMLNSKLGDQAANQVYSDLYTLFLAKNKSFMVAYVDVTGSGNRGERLTQSIYGDLGVKEAADLQNIIRYFKQPYFKVNESLIAVMGFGYGGFVALHVAKQSVVSCTVAVAPLTDLNNLDLYNKQRYLGSEEIDRSLALNYMCDRKDDCTVSSKQNIFIIHGVQDEVISYKNSMSFIRELQLAGYNFRQQIYPEVGHNIRESKVYKHYYQSVTNFISECFTAS